MNAFTTQFLRQLKINLATLQASKPEHADALSRANAAILNGHVDDLGNGTGMVMHTEPDDQGKEVWFAVSDQGCTCDEAELPGTICKHLAAWKLYRHIQRKTLETIDPEDGLLDDTQAQEAAQPQPPSFSEPPVSFTLKTTPMGLDAMITFRGLSFQAIEAEATAALHWLEEHVPVQIPPSGQPAAVPPPQATRPSAPAQHAPDYVPPMEDQPRKVASREPGANWCAGHQAQMRVVNKNGDSWWSHRLQDGSYCKGIAA